MPSATVPSVDESANGRADYFRPALQPRKDFTAVRFRSSAAAVEADEAHLMSTKLKPLPFNCVQDECIPESTIRFCGKVVTQAEFDSESELLKLPDSKLLSQSSTALTRAIPHDF